MSNARDDKDRLQNNNKRRGRSETTFTPSEEIGQMHFSTENYSTAIEYFERALESSDLKDYPDRYRLYLSLADCYRNKGNFKEAQKFLGFAKALLEEPAPSEALGKLESREALILFSQAHYDQALKLGFSSYRRLKHSNEHKEVADVQRLLANCYLRLGLSGEAEEFFMDALSSYRRIEDRVGIAVVYNNLGLLHKNACRWNRALASLSKSLELAKSLGLTQHLIRVQLNLGVVYSKLRRFSEAQSAFTSAATMAERFGDDDKLTKAILMQGRTLGQCGDYAKAEKYILRGQAMANEHGYGRESALADEFLGELMLATRRPDEALVNFNQGLAKAKKIAPEGDAVAEMLRRVADTQFMLRQYDQAVVTAQEGLEVAGMCGESYEMGYLHRTLGLARLRRRDFAGAVESLRKSVETFEEYGNPFEMHRSQQFLGRVYLRNRDRESWVKAKQVLTDSVVGLSAMEESKAQMMSQVLLAVVDERLENLDDALLAVYEADRLADEVGDEKYKKIIPAMRTRIEAQMTRDTRKVLEQIPVFGNLQSSTCSRDKLIPSLEASLTLTMNKLNAGVGFVAIPSAAGTGLDVVTFKNITRPAARKVLEWYRAQREATSREDHGLFIVTPDRENKLNGLAKVLSHDGGTLVFQSLGFENESLGVIFVHQNRSAVQGPLSQEALHFVAAYSRLLSLSIYELVRNERRREPKTKPAASGFESIVTENNEMIKLLNLAERVGHSNATVLLQGETGTGKGLIAYAIHLLSDRRDKRFVHINCAAMPESLLESELFGHVKGSFTGANADKEGLLQQADGGTIFLDEIGKTTLAMQGKLLQFLDAGKIRRVGSNEMIPVDVRVICASKGDLMTLCDEGRFLEDFFYRINDFPLTIPPLRRRREDVELLFYHYLRKYSREMGKNVSDIDDDALELLKTFRWPGNVRELDKVVKRAVILTDDGESIGRRHLPPEIVHASGSRARGEKGGATLRDQIDALEKREIRAALERCNGNKSQAALQLGISYPSLLSKIKRYHLRGY